MDSCAAVKTKTCRLDDIVVDVRAVAQTEKPPLAAVSPKPVRL